jgi:hypothetical protein
MARILQDEEIACIIAPSDSDWLSKTDDSFEPSLESDSSFPTQKPKVTAQMNNVSNESDESRV